MIYDSHVVMFYPLFIDSVAVVCLLQECVLQTAATGTVSLFDESFATASQGGVANCCEVFDVLSLLFSISAITDSVSRYEVPVPLI